jgi:hypothetical protein
LSGLLRNLADLSPPNKHEANRCVAPAGKYSLQLMKSQGYFEDRKILATKDPALNHQSFSQTPPEFGLNSLKR